MLECAHDGRVLRQFGSGNPGFSDGLQTEACFDDPQGLARWRVAMTGQRAKGERAQGAQATFSTYELSAFALT